MLPGIPPTGKHVELPNVIIMKFNAGKIAHKHILGSGIAASTDWSSGS
jgi:predicted ester cyclase